jgi:hypothetical protein
MPQHPAATTAYQAISPMGYHSAPLLTDEMVTVLREAGYVLGKSNPQGYLLGAESWDCSTCGAPIGEPCYATNDAEAAKAYVSAHEARRDLSSVRIA